MVAQRAIPIVALACSLLAFVLSMVSLFAGASVSFLPNVYMFRLNTGSLGKIQPFGDTDSGDSGGGGFFDNPLGTVKDAAQDLGNKAASAAGEAAAGALNLDDFYSAHLMTFCSGDLKPNPEDPAAQPETTFCSERKAFFSFDIGEIVESKLPKGVSLSDLNLPDSLTNGLKALGIASKAMYFFFIIGIAASALGIIGAAFGFLAYRRITALLNLAIASSAAICLALGAVIATVIASKASSVVNEKADSVGLSAVKGTGFLGMVWAAAVLMILASIGWVFGFLAGSGGRKSRKDYY